MGAFAYVSFAAVARFFFGDVGFFLVTIAVVALTLPPFLRVHRRHKQAREKAILYRPIPEKVPGQKSPTRLEAAILASFILGASAVIFLIVGYAARIASALGGYSNLGLWVAGYVLTGVAQAVVALWFWSRWSAYDPCDPYASLPP